MMNRIVVALCCALATGVAGAAARSGVVVIVEANVSDQGMANSPADARVQSNVRTQFDASPSTGIIATASVNPALTARIRRLESSFRCLMCQNETIADSTADLAADLRLNIHEQVEQGATDAQIRDYMAILCAAVPLMQREIPADAPKARALTVSLYRRELADADLHAGALSEDQRATLRSDIERRVLMDTAAAPSLTRRSDSPSIQPTRCRPTRRS
ncbi:cytochrome c-type biogenesis protein CcmH [Caballeronia sp. SEWSISQ10-4 2]|uniref:cytochrome c-type biogenesis protein CcmH n=1 Tax=Caballeronia sp. SEWSISQ10-4 2 TaxID=2937438 RepID=UPI002653B3A2|nr:cytochrome c-type biogenesis protein CcmH [Caballeronia sp. SEWSISQ10-4 2]MDN7182946.1 cytochrome c-type biogenesis protein CcmH [Caballeronia sp. SEWSISQ10-4 2]